MKDNTTFSLLVVVLRLTNDEITVGPIAGIAVAMPLTPWLAKGQGSLTLGEKTLTWSVEVTCKVKGGGHSGRVKAVSGTLPWKSIQTVVIPC